MSIRFEEIPGKLRENGKRLAKATAEWEFSDGMIKTMLATHSPKEGKTESEKERTARTHPEFIQYMRGVRDLRQLMLDYKFEQESLQASFDYFRSMNANRRTEMQVL